MLFDQREPLLKPGYPGQSTGRELYFGQFEAGRKEQVVIGMACLREEQGAYIGVVEINGEVLFTLLLYRWI